MGDQAPRGRPDVALLDPSRAGGPVVRHFQDGEEEEILRLLQAAFPRWPRVNVHADPLDHVRWKMRLDESEERMHKVALRDGAIAGMLMTSSRPAKVRDRIVRCWQNADACAHPDVHARGTMTAIRDAGRDDDLRPYALSFSLQSRHPAIRKMRDPASRHRGVFGNRLERFVRPLHPLDVIEAFRFKPGRAPLKLAASAGRFTAWLGARLRDLTTRRRAHAIRTVTAQDERMDAFWNEAAGQFDFIMVRDNAYLTWRYLDPRAPIATLRVAEEAGRVLGYAALTIDHDRRAGYLADLLVLPGRSDVAHSLVRDAVERARRAGARRVEMWLPERHPYRDVLEDSGFVMRRRKQLAGYRVMGDATAEELAFLADRDARTHITLGDTDRV